MLDFKSYIVTTLKNDATLQTYLRDAALNMNIFPTDVDLSPEQFPCIVYQDAGVSVLSRPQGMHVGMFQLSIFSINSAIEVENIYERLSQLINFKDSTTQTIPNSGTLWWMREDNVRDAPDAARRMWQKIIVLKFWMSKGNAS